MIVYLNKLGIYLIQTKVKNRIDQKQSMEINSRANQKAKPKSPCHDKKVTFSQKQRTQRQQQKFIDHANPIVQKEGKRNKHNNIKKEHLQKGTSQDTNNELIGSYNRKEDARICSKTLQSEFDEVEDKLKNRDIGQEELEKIANQHFISKLIQTFYQHATLRQQIARIILQIHSYFQIRKCLYAQVHTTGKYPPIGLSITPMLVHSFHFVNQSAAMQCLQDVTSQGKVDLIENLTKVDFLFKSDGLTQGDVLLENIEYLIKLWVEDKDNVFINKLIEVILSAIKLAPSQASRIESKKSKRSDKAQMKRSDGNNTNKGKTFPCMTSRQQIIRLLVIVFTNFSYFQPHSKMPMDSDHVCFSNLALEMLRIYIKVGSMSVRIPVTDGNELLFNRNSQCMLLYKWALLSLCDWLVVASHQNTTVNKKNKHRNRNKIIFASILNEICTKIPLRKLQPEQRSSMLPGQVSNQSITQMATFLFSILMPFHSVCSQPILSDEYRFLVVINYGELILDIIANINVEDNVESNSVGLVLQSMFGLAEFCDQYKKRYKLEAMISKIQTVGIIENQPVFEPCESMLYRVLIGIQKCLPKYSLKYYKKQYINKPGIFHLYFIDQILQVRQPHEVGHFLLQLVETWVSVQMRDFNLLGYICKFMLKYLTANSSSFETKVKGIQALLTFFKQLTPLSLVHLNVLFYDSSFSDQACVEYTQQTIQSQKQQEGNTNSVSFPFQSHISKNQSLGLLNGTLNLSCILPPSTLSAYQQQSQIKSCGYSCIDRCVFINRNFLTGNQLCSWENILVQIFDDEFYYHCKYFYHLLSEAYLTKSDIGSARDSLTNDENNSLNQKIDRIIQIWEQSIASNKVGLIQSIFQLFMCWTNSSSFVCHPNNSGLTLAQLKKILSLLLQHSEKMLTLPYIYYQNWKEAVKQMQANSQIFENFKKEQQKIRNKQLYLICSIVKFIQNLAPIIFLVIPKSLPLEFFVQVVKKYSNFCGGKTCWALLRAIGDRMSSNIFLEQAVVVLRHGDGPGKLLRRKLQLYRQLIFGHTEENKTNSHQQNSRGEKQNSNAWGNSSKSRPRKLQNVMQTQLKLRLPQIIQKCIEVLSSTFGTTSKSSQATVKANQLKNQKEELYNKMIALQVVQEVFDSFLTCSRSAKIINFFLNQSNLDKGSIAENGRIPSKRKQNQNVLQKLHVTIIRILFRDSLIVTKYERKLIMHFRILALSWVCNSKSIILTQYLCRKHNCQSWHFGLLKINQLILVLWHCAIDEEIQMRIQVLQILTNTAKSEQFSHVNQQLYYTCAILTLACSLEPKQKLKIYGEKIIQKLHDSILKANSGNNANCSGFFLGLALSLGYLIFNSKVSLPCLDIFDTFVNLWVRANKDVCYLLLSALDEIENQSYRFSHLKMGQNDKQLGNLGCDLKILYMNIKNKRGWTNCQSKLEAKMSWLQNSESILKHLRCSIAEKIKHAKFLKSKKEVYFDIEQFLQAENMLIMQKVQDEGAKIGGWQEDEQASIRNKNYGLLG